MEASGDPAIPDPSAPRPASCTLHDNVVTAAGTFEGGYVPETIARSGAVGEMYVYASPTVSNAHGMHVADLGREHPHSMLGVGPWSVAVPVDSELELAVRCAIAVQGTHHVEGATNAH